MVRQKAGWAGVSPGQTTSGPQSGPLLHFGMGWGQAGEVGSWLKSSSCSWFRLLGSKPTPSLPRVPRLQRAVSFMCLRTGRNRSYCTHFSLPRLPHGGLIYTGDGAGGTGSVPFAGSFVQWERPKNVRKWAQKLIPFLEQKDRQKHLCLRTLSQDGRSTEATHRSCLRSAGKVDARWQHPVCAVHGGVNAWLLRCCVAMA